VTSVPVAEDVISARGAFADEEGVAQAVPDIGDSDMRIYE
jgi:hypothetical protein